VCGARGWPYDRLSLLDRWASAYPDLPKYSGCTLRRVRDSVVDFAFDPASASHPQHPGSRIDLTNFWPPGTPDRRFGDQKQIALPKRWSRPVAVGAHVDHPAMTGLELDDASVMSSAWH